MSAEQAKRMFLGAKQLIFDDRAFLNPKTIEALECCKSMLQAGVFIDVQISVAMTKELEEVEG